MSDWFVSGELDSFVSKLPFLSATLIPASLSSTCKFVFRFYFEIIFSLLVGIQIVLAQSVELRT